MCHHVSMIVVEDDTSLLATYFKGGTSITYKKGELVIRPQESPEYIYFIESGYVKAYSVTKYGEENLHVIRHSNEIFPLIWTFTEAHKDVAYEVMEQSVIWRQPRDDYLKYLKSDPAATMAILNVVMRAYRTFAEHVNTLEYRTVRERTASFLLACCRRFGTKNADGSIQINAPLRQQDIASSVNASRETTGRELSVLTRQGLIEVTDRYFIVINPSKLEAML